jgi:hypothetical protein
MSQRQSSIDRLCIVNGSDQPVSVVLDIEDHITIHIVRVWETRSQFNKVAPSGQFHNLDPGTDASGGLGKLF